MKHLIIIGGGASGLMAAITAARTNTQAQITILERKDIPGKKILSTGNGRCNFTNTYMDISCFRSDNIDLAEHILADFGADETLRFFESLGIVPKSRNGYIYPKSDQAQAVQELLQAEALNLGVHIDTSVNVTAIESVKKGFRIEAEKTIIKENFVYDCKNKGKNKNGSSKKNHSKAEIEIIRKTYQSNVVILAAGGRAASVLGSDGSGYTLAKQLGHSIVPVVPALVQLKVKHHPFAKAAGVRVDAKVTAYVDGHLMAEDTGEVQITAYGISGIPVFQISRYIAKGLYKKQPSEVRIDFLPDMSEEEVLSYLINRRNRMPERTTEEYLTGIFNKKLIPCLLTLAGISNNIKVNTLTDKYIKGLSVVLKRTTLEIADTNGFDNAQVCAGGVPLTEIHPQTMESRCIDGLYLTGELLDVDGICGGYNLQWAWTTGYLAGINAI